MPVVLALFSAVVYGVGDWLGGRASRVQASLVVAALGQTISLFLVGAVVLVAGTPAPGAPTWWWAAGAGIVGSLGIVGLYHGFAHGDVTVVAPVSAVVGAAVPAVVGIAMGERPGALALVGIVVAVGAVALVSGAFGTHQHNTPPRIVLLAVAVGACFGLLFVGLDRTDTHSGMWPLVIARFASVPFLLLVTAGARVRPVAHRGSLGIAAAAGVFDMGANLLYLVAVRGGMMSIVAVVASLYPASTVVLAMSVDHEKVSRWQIIGMGAAAVALVLVSLSRQ